MDSFQERLKATNSKDYRALRQRVFERDRFTCRDCGLVGVPGTGYGQVQAHHAVSLMHGGENEAENLITLCRACHNQRHKTDKPKRKRHGRKTDGRTT